MNLDPIHGGVVLEEFYSVGKTQVEPSSQRSVPWERPHAGAGAENKRIWMKEQSDCDHYCPFPWLPVGGGGEGLRLKLRLGRKWGEGEVVLICSLSSHPSTLLLICNKLK